MTRDEAMDILWEVYYQEEFKCVPSWDYRTAIELLEDLYYFECKDCSDCAINRKEAIGIIKRGEII